MDVTPQLAAGAQRIESYGPGNFRISGTDYTTPVLVMPQSAHVWDGQLTMESLAPLLTEVPEILLVGTGKRHEMVAPDLKLAFKAKKIGLDSMDSGAAARTFNILMAEGRRVAAALLLV